MPFRFIFLLPTLVLCLCMVAPVSAAPKPRQKPGLIVKIKTHSQSPVGHSFKVTNSGFPTRDAILSKILTVLGKQNQGILGGLMEGSINENEPIRSLMTGRQFELLRVDTNGKDPKRIAQEIAAISGVQYVEPDSLVHLVQPIPDVLPDILNDTDYVSQWALRPKNMAGGSSYHVNVLPVWAQGFTGSKKVVVAIVDSGIDMTHPDLAANLFTNPNEIPDDGIDNDENEFEDDVHGWNFDDFDAEPIDEAGHGTHVAGIIGAVGNNNLGISGINWNVQLLPVRVLDADGAGTVSSVVQGIEYAIRMKAAVINLSLGGPGYEQPLYDAISEARSAGVIVVAAAGNEEADNDGYDPCFPASFDLDNIISVGAIDSSGELSDFSNYGQTSVHLAAPGEKIYSTSPSDKYKRLNGTSMAAPMVTGAVALLKSIYPEESYSQIIARITGCTKLLPEGSVDKIWSGGTLDIEAASKGGACTDLTQPSPSFISIQNLRSSSVLLEWSAMPGALSYQLAVDQGDTAPEECPRGGNRILKPQTKLDHLLANTTYSARLCVYARGKKVSSTTTTFTTTAPEITDLVITRLAPTQLSIMMSSPDEVDFTFDAITEDDPQLSCDKLRWRVSGHLNGKLYEAKFNLVRLRSGTPYTLIACAKSRNGSYSQPLIRVVGTPPGIIPQDVLNLRSVGLQSDSIKLDWDAAESGKSFEVHLVEDSPGSTNSTNQAEVFETGNLSISLSELKPETAYTVRIKTVDAEQGTVSIGDAAVLRFITPRPAMKVFVSNIGKTHAEFRVLTNFSTAGNLKLRMAIFVKNSKAPGIEPWSQTNYDGPHDLRSEIYGLKKGKKYRIVFTVPNLPHLAAVESKFTTGGTFFEGHEGW